MWPGAKSSSGVGALGSSNNNKRDSNDETDYLLNICIHYKVNFKHLQGCMHLTPLHAQPLHIDIPLSKNKSKLLLELKTRQFLGQAHDWHFRIM